jgi:hypothetical protein
LSLATIPFVRNKTLPAGAVLPAEAHLELMVTRWQWYDQGPDIALAPLHQWCLGGIPGAKLLAAADHLEAISKANVVVCGDLHQGSLILLQELQLLL